jgi:hypothetical protein
MSSAVHAAIGGEGSISHMQSTGERLLVGALALLALGAGATTASAATAQSARFKGELSGTQFAKTDLGTSSECDVELPSGTSTERIEFQSTTFRLLFTELPPSEIVLGRTGTVRMPVNGTVTRSLEGSAACLADPKRPVDCGTKPIGDWRLDLQWKTRGFYLITNTVRDVFDNCPSRLLFDPYPELFGAADDEPNVVARASIAQLLNRRKKQIVAVGKGSHRTTGTNGEQLSVELDYRLTLTRIAQPRRRR